MTEMEPALVERSYTGPVPDGYDTFFVIDGFYQWRVSAASRRAILIGTGPRTNGEPPRYDDKGWRVPEADDPPIPDSVRGTYVYTDRWQSSADLLTEGGCFMTSNGDAMPMNNHELYHPSELPSPHGTPHGTPQGTPVPRSATREVEATYVVEGYTEEAALTRDEAERILRAARRAKALGKGKGRFGGYFPRKGALRVQTSAFDREY